MAAMPSVNCCRASPTVTATDTARQRWPAQPKALSPMMRVARLEVRIGQDQHVVFSAALALHSLPA
jgi:hypothetical protein